MNRAGLWVAQWLALSSICLLSLGGCSVCSPKMLQATDEEICSLLVSPKLFALPLDWDTVMILGYVPHECSKAVPPKPLVSPAPFQRVCRITLGFAKPFPLCR